MGADPGTGALVRPQRGLPPVASPVPTGPLIGAPSKRLILPRWMVLILAIAAQVAFARAMITVPQLGRVQVAAVVLVVLWAVLKRAAAVSLCLIAYIPAMEI